MGFVNDFVIAEGKIYVANDAGTIDIFDLKTKKIINQIVLDPITSRMGQLISPKTNS